MSQRTTGRVKDCLDWIVCALVRILFRALQLLPHPVRVYLFGGMLCVTFVLVSRLRKTAMINLAIAFPERSKGWRRSIFIKSAVEMGRLLSDTVRLSSLDAEWVRKHVSIPALELYIAARGEKGVLVTTGHLGSFELLGHAIGLMGHPLAAVARKFKSPRLDAWWTGLREARGNKIIDRTGAFKEIVKNISAGRSVAVLFDQNVKLNHAVFVDWFSKPAATTRAVALAALKTRVPIFVASIAYRGKDRYVVDAVRCDFSSLYDDSLLSDEQKILQITQQLSDHYCRMIREFPEGWFWVHRRWKTRPPGEEERVYR